MMNSVSMRVVRSLTTLAAGKVVQASRVATFNGARCTATPIYTQMYSIQSRYMSGITEDSWASERLEELGVKLEPGSTEEIVVAPNTINEPSAAVTKLAEQILKLNMVEVNQLLKVLEKTLGGLSDDDDGDDDSDDTPKKKGGKAAAAPVAEKTSFDLKLGPVDQKAKIKIIKEVRVITGLGLKEAKELVEKAPVMLKQGLKKEEIEAFKKVLIEAGAVVEVL